VKITTNHKPRQLVGLSDLPAKEIPFFDYIKEDDAYTPRLVQYKGTWYDVYDTMRTSEVLNHPFQGYDSYISDSFFSGVLFRLMPDDYVICGSYYA
jgi:hypothetical protein